MPKQTRGLYQDSTPQNQPQETYFFGKNGIQADKRGSIENEPGFYISSAIIPYGTPIGVIETDFHPVIFSTNNINSAIWYYDEDNDEVITILDDANLTFLLGFNTSYYITGQAQRNYKGEVIVTFTDKRPNPRYLNCDKPEVKSAEDLLLFPLAQAPTIVLSQDSGGNLFPGSYFAAVRLIKNDGTQTAFLVISTPIIIAGQTGQVQNVSIIVTLTDIDTNYDIVEVAIVQKVGGVFSQGLLDQAQIAPTTTLTYTGTSPLGSIDLSEILQNPVVYKTIGTMGQLNDYLYNGNLTMLPEISMQKYANLIQLKWRSELHTVFPADPDIVSGNKRSFCHREVYAAYIQYSLVTGGWSRAFHIPGLALVPADLVNSVQAAVCNQQIPKYKVEDTVPSFDFNSRTGQMGKWVNATETYPDTVDFDSSDIGGENLRGRPVRHHRMPSIRWCKQNLYQYEAAYAKTSLDILGVDVTNVIIPTEYQGSITGYRILYAERSLGNATVAGQALYLQGGRTGQLTNASPNQNIIGGDTNYLSSGGNWWSQIATTSVTVRPITPDPRLVRMHPFDLIFNQPAINPDYIVNELKHIHNNVSPKYMIEDGSNSGNNVGNNEPLVFLLDYLTNGLTPTVLTDNLVYRNIVESTYAPANLINGKWNNLYDELCYAMVCGGPEVLHIGNGPTDPASEFSLCQLGAHDKAEKPEFAVQFERTCLTNLMFLRDNLYVSFTSQSLVIANSRVSGNANSTIFGGDTFINDYTFHTYGWQDAVNNNNFGSYSNDGTPAGAGIRVCRRFACEAASNINDRFIVPGNQYSEWYPKQPLVKDDPNNYLTLFKRTSDPNQFGYSKDLNALNNLISTSIFNPTVEIVTDFPYRIHRSGKLGRLDKRRSWRTFDPLDFYEMQKNMGFIINLAGQDDRLLIHMEKALFMTQDKTKLQAGVLSVTLSAGDIFQFEPQEAISAKLGYAGTQHDLACVLTPIGYVFIDSAQGQIFLHKGTPKLLNLGMNSFFRVFARVTETNSYTGNGYTIGYDPYYKRILVTAKNKQLVDTSQQILDYIPTQEFINSLVPGVSIVRKDGRLQRFLGVNSSPDYACPVPAIPSIQNYVISVGDATPIGTQVLMVAGVNIDDVYIISGNTPLAWALSTDGSLKVNGGLDHVAKPQYILVCKALNIASGNFVTFTITINITADNKPPVTGNQNVDLPEFSPVTTPVAQVQASGASPLTYSIVSGNTGNAFTIDGNGALSVLTPSALDMKVNPTFTVVVAVSDGTNTVNSIITVTLTYVNTPPSSNDVIVTIPDTTLSGTEIADLSTAVQDNGVDLGLLTLTFEVLDASVPGAFSIDDNTGIVAVVDGDLLHAANIPQYIINMRATDNGNPSQSSIFRLIINVTFDPSTLQFIPANGSCNGGSCPVDYVLSPDGTQCQKTTSTNATAPSGPQIQAGPAIDGSYSNFGAMVYDVGPNTNGTGTVVAELTNGPVWANPLDTLVDGPLNRCGIWGTTAIPINQPIGFSIPVLVPTTKVYYIAIAGDNKVKITLNGVTVIDQDPTAMAADISAQFPIYSTQGIALAFKIWHIYPILLPAGHNYIGLEGVNFGGAAGFGAEIYNNTLAELMAAQLDPAYIANPDAFPANSNFYTNLNLIFTTRSCRGLFFTSGVTNAYSCSPGTGGLDPTQTPPQCVLIQTTTPTVNTKHWASVEVYSTKLAQTVATLNNVAGQTFQGIAVPNYPDVPNHIDCGGSIRSYLSVQKSAFAIKEDCAFGQGSVVQYYSQAGKYMSLVSQADADAQAQADVDNNKQAYADANGTCSV